MSINENKKYYKAYYRRAQAYEEMKKLKEALKDYEITLSFKPGNKNIKSKIE